MTKRLIFLMNRWASTAGGIQTVNRKLISALARTHEDIECIAIVTVADAEEKYDAATVGVRLIAGTQEDNWVEVLLSSEVQDLPARGTLAVIGHSYFSGREALSLRNRLFPRSKFVHFVHMNPMGLESFKEYKQDTFIFERETKLQREIEIAKAADFVGCIGPRLFRAYSDELQSIQAKPTVFQVDCGIERAESVHNSPLQPTILSMGRPDSVRVKGLDILAKAAGRLSELWNQDSATKYLPFPRFVIRGAKEKPEEFEKQLSALASSNGRTTILHVRPYTSDSNTLRADLRGASIFVMPSREEGFGLVACEALSAGVPVLAASSSGFAETLRSTHQRTNIQVENSIIVHDVDDEELAFRYANAIMSILKDTPAAVQHAFLLREDLMQTNSWEQAADTLLQRVVNFADDNTFEDEESNIRGATAADDPIGHFQENLSKNPDVLSVITRRTVVVAIRKGAKLEAPGAIDGADIVVEEIDAAEWLSGSPSSGEQVLHDDRPIARVGLWAANDEGNIFAITVAHAIPGDSGALSVRTSEGDVSATVADVYPQADLVALGTPSVSGVRRRLLIDSPQFGQEVLIETGTGKVQGIVSGVRMMLRNNNASFQGPIQDAFEVEIQGAQIKPGDSGSVVLNAAGNVVGLVVARTVVGGSTRVHAVSIERALEEARLVPISLTRPISGPARNVGRRRKADRLCFVVLDQSLLKEMLGQLDYVYRRKEASNFYFAGRLKESGQLVYIAHILEAGPISSAVAMTHILADRLFSYVLVLGEAAGIDIAYPGSVVISTEIVHLSNARSLNQNVQAPYSLHGFWRADKALRQALVEMDLDAKESNTPPIYIGAVVSADATLHDWQMPSLSNSHRKPLAFEMASSGIAAATEAYGQPISTIFIYGIVEAAFRERSEKHDEIRSIAAKNCVAVALRLAGKLTSLDKSEHEF